MKNILSIIAVFLLAVSAFGSGLEKLQNQNVLVKNSDGAGSGVVITKNIGGQNISFVITAAHIVNSSRVVKSVIGPTKIVTEKVEFKDVLVKMEKFDDTEHVTEISATAKIIAFIDTDDEHDFAILMINKPEFTTENTKFIDNFQINVGDKIHIVGNPDGEPGINTMSSGIIARKHRYVDGCDFLQIYSGVMPGFSGGGIYNEKNEYIGMLVGRRSETIGLALSFDKIRKWCGEAGYSFLFDDKLTPKSLKDIESIPVETHKSTIVLPLIISHEKN